MPDCDPALSGAAIRRCEFQKALCLRRIVAAFIAITVAISVTTTPPVPAAAITLATTFSVAGSQPRRLQVPDRHSSHRRVHGSDHVPAAEATADPVSVGTGKSGVFRAFAHACGQFGFADIPLDKLLDGVEFPLFLLAHEGNGPPGSRGTRRAADAVDVILGIVRHVIVEHQSDILDVDTACHDVRRYENPHFIILKVEHHLLALLLIQVGVHGSNVEPHTLECMGQLLDLHLRRREDDRLRVGRLGEQLADDVQLLVLIADVGRLVDGFVGFRNGDVHLGGIAQNRLGQLADLRAAASPRTSASASYGIYETICMMSSVKTHIEHTVGLVQNQAIHVRKVDAAVYNVGDQASRSGDHHIGTRLHAALLHVPAAAVAAAVNYGGRNGHIVGKALELHVDLLCQLARGYDNHRFHDVLRRCLRAAAGSAAAACRQRSFPFPSARIR